MHHCQYESIILFKILNYKGIMSRDVHNTLSLGQIFYQTLKKTFFFFLANLHHSCSNQTLSFRVIDIFDIFNILTKEQRFVFVAV